MGGIVMVTPHKLDISEPKKKANPVKLWLKSMAKIMEHFTVITLHQIGAKTTEIATDSNVNPDSSRVDAGAVTRDLKQNAEIIHSVAKGNKMAVCGHKKAEEPL